MSQDRLKKIINFKNKHDLGHPIVHQHYPLCLYSFKTGPVLLGLKLVLQQNQCIAR